MPTMDDLEARVRAESVSPDGPAPVVEALATTREYQSVLAKRVDQLYDRLRLVVHEGPQVAERRDVTSRGNSPLAMEIAQLAEGIHAEAERIERLLGMLEI